MDDVSQLIAEIEAFASERGLAPSTVTTYAATSGTLYRRLKAGCDCNSRTAAKIRAWMQEQREASKGAAA